MRKPLVFGAFIDFDYFFPNIYVAVLRSFLANRKSCHSFSRELAHFLGRVFAEGGKSSKGLSGDRFSTFVCFASPPFLSSQPFTASEYAYCYSFSRRWWFMRSQAISGGQTFLPVSFVLSQPILWTDRNVCPPDTVPP